MINKDLHKTNNLIYGRAFNFNADFSKGAPTEDELYLQENSKYRYNLTRLY